MTTPQRLLAVGLLAAGVLCGAARAAAPNDTAADEAKIKAKLAQKIAKLEFTDIEFKDVVQFLRDVTQLNIQVRWAALGVAGIDRSTAVNVHLRDITAAEAVRTILDDVAGKSKGVDYLIRGNILTISTTKDIDSHTEVRIYDVRDLKQPVKDRPYRFNVLPPTWQSPSGSPRYRRYSGGGTGFFDDGGGGGGGDGRSTPKGAKGRLAEFIRETIDPTSWRTSGGETGNINAINGHFAIMQTRRNHERIAKLLGHLRATWCGPIVTVKARWITLPSKNAGVIFTKGNPPVAATGKALDAAGAKTAYQGVISGFDGQTVHVVQGHAQTFLTGAIPIVCDAGNAFRPVTQGMLWGAALQVRPRLSDDGKTVTISVLSTVSRPKGLRTKEVRSRMGKGRTEVDRKPDVVLDCVDFAVQTLSTTVRFPLDTPVVVGGMTAPTEARDKVMYLVLEVSASKAGKTGKPAPK